MINLSAAGVIPILCCSPAIGLTIMGVNEELLHGVINDKDMENVTT